MKAKPKVCRSAKRVVHIGEQEWRYMIGKCFVHIYGPDGVKVYNGTGMRKQISVSDILGGMDVERAKHKGWFPGVKPSDVKKFIEENFVNVDGKN